MYRVFLICGLFFHFSMYRSRQSNRSRKPTGRLLGSEMLLVLLFLYLPYHLFISLFFSPTLPRTSGISTKKPKNFFDAASEADSDGDQFSEPNSSYELGSFVVDDAGDKSPIEWSVTPPPPVLVSTGDGCVSCFILFPLLHSHQLPCFPHRLHYAELQDEAEDMDTTRSAAASPTLVIRHLLYTLLVYSSLLVISPSHKHLYSNRVRIGTPEENRPSSPVSYRYVLHECFFFRC